KNATSILDYIFRELAVSYLGRNDLAHVEPSDLRADALGDGADEGNLPDLTTGEEEIRAADAALTHAMGLASTGYVRSNLYVLNPEKRQAAAQAMEESATVMRTAGGASGGATVSQTVAYSETKTVSTTGGAGNGRAKQVAEARMKGYEGDSCDDCGNFTLVRNGTCMKCDTCGATTGCS
ncbi:MAG: hypothetical protein P1U37_15055, partial [Minwuia sp.]|nr:hypothetical protein [Minwuia sp.]